MNILMVCIAAIERVKKSGVLKQFMQGHKKWNEHTFDDSNLARKFLCLMIVLSLLRGLSSIALEYE